MLVYQLKLLKGKIQNEEINQVSKIRGTNITGYIYPGILVQAGKLLKWTVTSLCFPAPAVLQEKKKKNPE